MNDRQFRAKPLWQAIGALSAATASLCGTPALAAEQQPGGLEEIVVTATRRAESQQNVAIPMTAVSGEALERAFAQDLRDLTAASPNVQLEPVGIFQNAASFFIRGQGTGDIESAADGKVAIFIDGAVQARVSTALSDFVDVQSVEILRGPQGTLFGRNTIAGAVQLLHNPPEMNELNGSAGIQVGDFGRQDVKGVVNFPIISDTLAGRVAVKSTNLNGYWDNSAPNVEKDRGGIDRLTVLPSLLWTPNENLEVIVRGEWNRTRDDTYMNQSHHYCRDDPLTLFTGGGSGPGGSPDNDLVITTQTLFNLIVLGQDPVSAAANASSICAVPIDDHSTESEWTAPNTEPRGQGADADLWGTTVEANYTLADAGTITYIGNYREVDEDIIFSIDASLHDLFAGRREQEHYQFSHEIRFASSFSDTWDFVAGAYYFQQEYTMKQQSWGLLFAPNVVLGPTLGFAGPVSFTSPETQGQAGFSNQRNDAWALFAQANWHVTDKLTLTGGGRYTEETKDFKHCAVGSGDPTQSLSDGTSACNNVPAFVIDPNAPLVPGTPTPLFPLMPAIGFDSSGGAAAGCRPVLDAEGAPITCNNMLGPMTESWSDFTPMAGITYQLTDDIMGFFTYTAGFTAGGFNGRAGSITTLGPFDPETADNFEVGVKSEWLENRLRVNVNAFTTTVEDFQTAFIRPAPNGGGQETIQSNLGELETKGVELEMQAVPTDNLSVWATLSWLDTERKDFCTDPDGPSGTDPDVPPTEGGPHSAGLPVCGPAQRINDATGNFVGWLVPNDLDELNPTGRSPEWTYSAGFAYDFHLASYGTLTLSADWQYQDEQTISGSRVDELPGVVDYKGRLISHFRDESDIYNASLVWNSPDSRYQLALFGKNLTDETFVQSVTNVAGLLNFRTANIRRHWGLEFNVNF